MDMIQPQGIKRIVITGADRSGKSCLMQRFRRGKDFVFSDKYIPTIGIQFTRKRIHFGNDADYHSLEMYDLAANEIFRHSFAEKEYEIARQARLKLEEKKRREEEERKSMCSEFQELEKKKSRKEIEEEKKKIQEEEEKRKIQEEKDKKNRNVFLKGLYGGSEGILLTYDISNKDSFKFVQKELETLKSIWKDLGIKKLPVMFLVGCKSDLEKSSKVSSITKEDIETFAMKNSMKHFTTSAKENTDVNFVFNTMMLEIIAASSPICR